MRLSLVVAAVLLAGGGVLLALRLGSRPEPPGGGAPDGVRSASAPAAGTVGRVSAVRPERGDLVLSGVVLRGGVPCPAVVEARLLTGLAVPERDSRSRPVAPPPDRLPQVVARHRSRAGDDGLFRFESVSPGPYVLLARADDGPGAWTLFRLEPGEERLAVLALEEAACVLRGRAVRADGRAYRGAVHVTITDPETEAEVPFSEARTGDDGSFLFEGLPRVAVTLNLLEPGRRRVRGPRVWLPHGEEVTFVVGGAERPVSGMVVDATGGAAVPGARVVLESEGEPPVAAWTETDDRGRFEATLPEGPARITVEADGFERASVRSEQSSLRLEVLRCRVVEGRVLADPDGAPVAGVTVGLPGTEVRVVSDAEGRYSLTVPSGKSVRVMAMGAGWMSRVNSGRLHREVPIPPGGRITLDLRVARAGGARGRVLDAAGEPVSGAEVTWESLALMWAEISLPVEKPRVRTGADGTYALDTLLPGLECYVVAESSDHRSGAARKLVPVSGKTELVDLTLEETARIDVLVVAEESGRPLPGASIARIGSMGAETETDLSGHARLVARGPRWVTAELPGRAGASKEVPEGVTSLTIALPLGRVLSGRVLLPDGSPAPGAVVIGDGERVLADGRGRFRLDSLRSGTLNVRARLRDGKRTSSAELRVEPPAEDVTLELRPDPAPRIADDVDVLVRIRDPAGHAVPRARLEFEDRLGGSNSGGTRSVRGGEDVIPVGRGEPFRIEVDAAADALGRPLPLGPAILEGPAPPAEVTLVLPPEQAIEGFLRDAAGRGLPGVPVRAKAVEKFRWTHHALTGPDGAFRIGGLGPREYLVSAEVAEDHLPVEAARVRAPARDVLLETRRAVTARLRVLDPGGRPVPLAGIEVIEPAQSGVHRVFAGLTDVEGIVLARRLDPDATYTLGVVPPDDRPDLARTDPRPWRPADGEVVLPGCNMVRVRVVDAAGDPVTGTTVWWRPVGEPGPWWRQVPCDPEGIAVLSPLPDGRVTLRALPKELSPEGPEGGTTVPSNAGDVTLRTDWRALRIVVDDMATETWGKGLVWVDGLKPTRVYGGEGVLVFEHLGRAQRADVLVRTGDGERAALLHDLGPGEHRIRLGPARPLRGRLLLPDRALEPGVRVLVAGRSMRVYPESDGRFDAGGLPPGTYTVEARVRIGDREIRRSVEVEAGTPVEIDLR